MGGKNYGICHSCRDPGHWLEDCPTKKRCPRCFEGFVRLLEVEKMSENRGKFFYSCTRYNCRYFQWLKPETGKKVEADVEELSRMMITCGRIAKEDDVDINMITFRKSKGSVSGKGKEKMEDS